MWIDIDLADDRMISSVGVRDPVRQLDFKRDTSAEINVRFWLAGIRQELAEDAAGEIGIKPEGEYDGVLLVYAGEWIKTGTGPDTYYTFTPAFDGDAITEQLGSGDGDVENDVTSVTGMLEIKWIADGKKHRTQTVQSIVSNDVLKDGDITPTPIVALWGPPLALTAPPEDGTGSLIVSGITNPLAANDTYEETGLAGGKARFVDGTSGIYSFEWSVANNRWELTDDSDVLFFFAEQDVDTPLLVTIPWTAAGTGAGTLVTALDGTAATAKGQLAIVTTTNDSGTFEDAWTCVRVSPVKWNPPGNIFRDRVAPFTLYRTFYSGGAPDTEEAYPA